MENNNLDQSVLCHIKELTDKEEQFYSKPDLNDEDVKALHAVKSQLD
jgi:hypothetical protein